MSNQIDPSQAVDLGEVAEHGRRRSAVMESQAQVAAEARIYLWDHAMNNAFKGILDGPTRRRMLRSAADRYEREQG